MLYVEVHINEDLVALRAQIDEAYVAQTKEVPPLFQMGDVIVWDGRLLQRIEFQSKARALEHENSFLGCSLLRRARVQVGSMNGEVFMVPPQDVGRLAARVTEAGASAEYLIHPFQYSAYRSDL